MAFAYVLQKLCESTNSVVTYWQYSPTGHTLVKTTPLLNLWDGRCSCSFRAAHVFLNRNLWDGRCSYSFHAAIFAKKRSRLTCRFCTSPFTYPEL